MLLEIKTCRYIPIYNKPTNLSRERHPSEILCALCELGSSEDEVNFLLLLCPLYQDLQLVLFRKAITVFQACQVMTKFYI